MGSPCLLAPFNAVLGEQEDTVLAEQKAEHGMMKTQSVTAVSSRTVN